MTLSFADCLRGGRLALPSLARGPTRSTPSLCATPAVTWPSQLTVRAESEAAIPASPPSGSNTAVAALRHCIRYSRWPAQSSRRDVQRARAPMAAVRGGAVVPLRTFPGSVNDSCSSSRAGETDPKRSPPLTAETPQSGPAPSSSWAPLHMRCRPYFVYQARCVTKVSPAL